MHTKCARFLCFSSSYSRSHSFSGVKALTSSGDVIDTDVISLFTLSIYVSLHSFLTFYRVAAK